MSYRRTDSDASPGEFEGRATANVATNTVITVLSKDPEVLRALRGARTLQEAAASFARLLQPPDAFLSSRPDLLFALAMRGLSQVDYVEAIRAIAQTHQLFAGTPTHDEAARLPGGADSDTERGDDLCDCGDPECPGCSCGMACVFAPGHDYDRISPAVSEDPLRVAQECMNALLAELAFAYDEQPEHFCSLASVRRARAVLAHFDRKRIPHRAMTNTMLLTAIYPDDNAWSQWSGAIYRVLYTCATEELLLRIEQAIEHFLQTEEGQSIVRSHRGDFNWGDAIGNVPLHVWSNYGIHSFQAVVADRVVVVEHDHNFFEGDSAD